MIEEALPDERVPIEHEARIETAGMWHFIRRYFGWYIWLGIYATAVGALIGLLCFSFPLLPIIVIYFVPLYGLALACAAPLNLTLLPIVFHAFRARLKRRTLLRLTGVVGGFFSPALGALAWCAFIPIGMFPSLFACRAAEPLYDRLTSLIGLNIAGAIAGFFCAGLFHKHGERPSVFDVNAALQPPLRYAAHHDDQRRVDGEGR
jgi:hypothetical protein